MYTPAGRPTDSRRPYATLGARVDFNFFNYGIGETYRRMRRWSPYLTFGMGMSLISCEGTAVAFNIPMGAGVRYKINPRLNLGVEWCMTKTFTDKVDGPVLSDLYGIKALLRKIPTGIPQSWCR